MALGDVLLEFEFLVLLPEFLDLLLVGADLRLYVLGLLFEVVLEALGPDA